jgi:TRAP-type mannitol/chloroaromatic compound transport system permease small subunit
MRNRNPDTPRKTPAAPSPAPPSGLLERTERSIRLVGLASALILIPLMIVVRVTEIATRPWNLAGSLFNAMEGELFLMFAFLTIGAAYVADAHVRVDVMADRFSPRMKAWIELIGLAVFVLPFAVIVLQQGAIRAALSFEDGERMALTFGAATRWVMFACVPLGVAFFTLAALCRAARALRVLRGGGEGRGA